MKHFVKKISFIIFLLAGTASSYGQMDIKTLDKNAAFSFSVMSDNKGSSVESKDMMHCDKWIKEAGDKFIIGLGDHVKSGWPDNFLDLIRTDTLWHNHFYPNVADGENDYWGIGQGDWGAGAPIFDSVELSKKPNVKMRRNRCEYYAVEEHSGIKIHIIQLHYSDMPPIPFLAFTHSSRKYLFKILNSIEKTDNDIIIVLAHTAGWVDLLNEKHRKELLSKADLLLDATTHFYKKYDLQATDPENSAVTFNTGSVGHGAISGFLQIHVFKAPLRMIIQYQQTGNDTRILQGKGFAFEKIIGGKTTEPDWNSFSN